MRKRYIKKQFFLFLMTASVFLTACGRKSTDSDKIISSNYLDEFVLYEDYDCRGETFIDDKGLCTQTEEGFFCLVGQYIFVYDYETKQTVPLCTKVDCLHNAETDERKVPECDAFCTPDTFIGYYDGHIYTVCPNRKTGDDYYVRMNPDGTDRVELAPYASMKDLYVKMHRGVIYRSYVGNDYDGNRSYRLEAMSIAGDSTAFVPIYEGNLENGRILYITAYHNNVMFCDRNDNERNEMIYNIQTKEICSIPDGKNYSNLGFCKDGVLLRGTNEYFVYSFKDKQIYPADPLYNRFQEEHPEWTCLFSIYDETIDLLQYPSPEGNGFCTAVIDKQGNMLFHTMEDSSRELSHGPFLMNGEEYLVFAEKNGADEFCINAYKKEELIKQETNPITLLDYDDAKKYSQGVLYYNP